MMDLLIRLLLAPALTCHASRLPGPPPRTLTADQTIAVYSARLDSFVEYFNSTIKTPADIHREFAGLSPRDQRQLRQETEGLTWVPRLERRGQTLVLSHDAEEVGMEFLDFHTNHVKIDGVHWTYDRTAPPSWQIRQFERAVARATRDQHAWLPSLMPRAFAQAGPAMEVLLKKAGKKTITGKVGGALASPTGKEFGKWAGIVMVAQGFATTVLCYGLSFATDDPSNIIFTCAPWQDYQDKKKSREFKDTIGYTDVIAKTLKWVRTRGFINCKAADKSAPEGKQIVETWMGEVPIDATGPAREARTWTYFRGTALNGTLKDGAIYKHSEEADDPKASSKAIAQFTYTDDPNNAVIVNLPRKGEISVATTDSVAYPANTKFKAITNPETAATVNKFQYMAQTAQSWTKACFANAFEAQFQRDEETAKGNTATDSAK